MGFAADSRPVLAWHCGTTVVSAGTSWVTIQEGGLPGLRLRGEPELAAMRDLLRACLGDPGAAFDGARTIGAKTVLLSRENRREIILNDSCTVYTLAAEVATDLLGWLMVADGSGDSVSAIRFDEGCLVFPKPVHRDAAARLKLSEEGARALARRFFELCAVARDTYGMTNKCYGRADQKLGVALRGTDGATLTMYQDGVLIAVCQLSRSALARLGMQLVAMSG